jgi:hypothetical protein
MNSLIQLAVDFLERMANPVYGAQVNEQAALEFAVIFDEEMRERFRYEAGQLRTPDALTSYGWTWLLNWAASEGVQLNADLLVELCETWESASFKAAVINAGTIGEDYSPQPTRNLEEFPDPWLRQLLGRAVHRTRTDDQAEQGQRPSRHAESLLVALILVERESTLDAASVLLNHEWDEAESVLRFFWNRMELLDQETEQEWRDRLSPPSLPDTFEQ